MNDFFDTVRRFLLDYLPKQRCLSENTILSYKQTLNLFVSYMQDERDVTATKLTFSRIDRDVILGFLTWLETARKCSANTRNQRLMALRSWSLRDKWTVPRWRCIFLPAVSPQKRLMAGSLSF